MQSGPDLLIRAANTCRGLNLRFRARPLDLYEDDDEGEQREGLDKYQTENHGGADGTGCSRVASHAFAGCGRHAALTETAAKGCNAHAEGCCDAEQPTSGVAAGGCFGSLRERCGSDEHYRRERG